MTEIHVAVSGDDAADGTVDAPLRTIDRAAGLAHPGDTVVVHAGTYREWVRPRRGGLSDTRRITYTAAEGEHVRITGAEAVTGWVDEGDGVWRVSVPSSLFGEWNPYAIEVGGDWIVYDDVRRDRKHLGDVYLNGSGSYEAHSVAEVAAAATSERTEIRDDWTGIVVPVRDVAQTRRAWYAEVGPDATTIWASFDGADPNAEQVEINVRRSVFYPDRHHVDYITVRGFELAQAACPWTPPTADQPGLIGPNWAKGWIIEDNVIHDAKCSAISIGKEASTGDNYATVRGDKSGYQYQLESVFSARQIGWDREHVGSHVIRRNHVYDCGQNGIVGHLGCVFSTIEDNHIHDIATRREFYGYEIAGIKLHAAIDVVIRGNRIHDCSLGTWLDWETQGTRLSRNVYYRNERDLFIEVSHGPYLVEHNVLASPVSLDNMSQGGAYVHNLVAGAVRLEHVRDRATPYHRPHSTQVAGYAVIEGGDDTWIGNVFLGGNLAEAYEAGSFGFERSGYGTAGYAAYPASFDEYLAGLRENEGDHRRFMDLRQPVTLHGNVYLAGARGRDGEADAVVVDGPAHVRVEDDGDVVVLVTDLPEAATAAVVGAVGGRDLPRVRVANADVEELDGSPAVIDVDLVGRRRTADGRYPAGPLVDLPAGPARTRVLD
ncbi:uncharacterized protein DUF1565 [Salana multivorans]|uniref:Uncharacterized protein DUF1565 n=1 Tax=Salana multivorans TaxID=120377 RepID=A0A3N2DCA2_9MICO|nr:right-handed parallel beta-helix repeat-containing protein [Salana multivorans]ROR97298.1 uncharacterized protein DUF1565 [Salana multivorans]